MCLGSVRKKVFGLNKAIYLIEADGSHGSLVQLLLKVLSHSKLLLTETVVSEQHANLHSYFDQVFDHLLGLRFASGVNFGDTVKFIQDVICGVVNEHLHRGFVGHSAENFLLCP